MTLGTCDDAVSGHAETRHLANRCLNLRCREISMVAPNSGSAWVFTRYVVAGGWNTLFGYAIFALLYASLSSRLHYVLLACVSNVLAITNAYIVHKTCVFRTRGNYLREYLRYYLVYGSTAVVGMTLLVVLVSGLRVSVYVAQACVMLIQIGVAFLGHLRYSFTKARPGSRWAPIGGSGDERI